MACNPDRSVSLNTPLPETGILSECISISKVHKGNYRAMQSTHSAVR